MRFQFQLPSGEFSRNDPSSNIITSGLATFDLKPWKPTKRTFGTLYPFAGFEIGRNLTRPDVINGIPVNLTHDRGIVRGLAGADALFALVDPKDVTTNLFSITGTYRLRLPTLDEPFIDTLHQVTSIRNTTKARHWVEADVTYTIPAWKYLSFTATYQYGDLPPIFTFVDHKVTIGVKLQAVQTTKTDIGLKLVP
jgi:hypothetical protein